MDALSMRPITGGHAACDSVYRKCPEQGRRRETEHSVVASGQGVMATGQDIFLGRENVLKLTIVMNVQLCARAEPSKFEG